ncbi:UDP-N-acetylglucosamine--N-acetylmuramyl-(pentapeptide) pyrophosphoryl-undecaprenol N-acetylglucosamine transferase [Streptomyces sp. FIT100]|nr:UDP-N-acetylglucosamine--N-acetylmuramyl-(pentapeptide) pyrophosphoryl-undecaprenol N-acetylglucosamine transferase [Streptomyces sp. FIT100]
MQSTGLWLWEARGLGRHASRALIPPDFVQCSRVTGAVSVSSNHRPFRLVVTGGGTGGHTYPALTALRTLQSRLSAQDRGLEVLWVGQANSLESKVAAAEGVAFTPVATGKIRRSKNPFKLVSRANVADMSRVPIGVLQARKAINNFRPDVVLATGGYVAVPVGIAATRLCHVPLVVHEQTVRLGLANKTLAGAATRVAVSSESTLPLLPEGVRAAAVVTGNPVRAEVFTGQADKAIDALGLRGFDRRLPTVYVTGGAQGSQQINRLVRDALPWLLEHANVVHQCGPDNVTELRQHTAHLPAPSAARYHLTGYVGAELPDILALADVVISRSGAGTIAELTALGKPGVFVPLATSAGNEQAHNARHLADNGAAVALVDDVTAVRLRDAVAPLLTDPERRAAMAERARSFGRPDAADRLVDVMLAAAGT